MQGTSHLTSHALYHVPMTSQESVLTFTILHNSPYYLHVLATVTKVYKILNFTILHFTFESSLISI